MAGQRRFVLTHNRAPGDVVVMTALVRDIHRTYPEFAIDVQTSAMDVWKHNPYLTPLRKGRQRRKDVVYMKLDYGIGIREQSHDTVHFIQYFHRDFKKKTGMDVPLTHPCPDLHLSPEEKSNKPVSGDYWLVISGGKSDFTTKVWHQDNFQRVVTELKPHGIRFVQVGSADNGHWHPRLDGALDLIGKTNLRDLFQLIYHSKGVLCGITMAMHVAAALDRPCVCLGGGREAWWWEAYVNENRGFSKLANGKVPVPHRYLHTIGQLDCCKYHGCWKNKVVPMGKDTNLCKMPVHRPKQPVPKCMDMITPEHVMEAILSYTDNSLPPVGQPALIVPPKPVAVPSLLGLFDAPANGNGKTIKPPPPLPDVPQLTGKLTGRGDVAAARTAATEPGRGRRKGRTPAPVVTSPVAVINDNVFDHDIIGGKFTAFVLLYGPKQFYDLHRRCLDSLIATMPAGRMELRVGSNELNPKSVAYVEGLKQQGLVHLHYRHVGNDKKYPVMREMFYDPQNPINTKWVLWFDDDTVCDKNPQWTYILAEAIIKNRPLGCHMYGDRHVWSMLNGQAAAYRSRPWHKGRGYRTRRGQEAANGDKVLFATGGFWALSVEAMRGANIPDETLGHNGGDVCIGEQLWQAGYSMKQWNGNKRYVNTSSVPRRGINEKHFGQV